MSLINAMSIMHYTALANNAMYSMIRNNNARMNLISSPMMGSDVSLEALSALDTQMELDSISNSIQYQIARAMLEQLKKQQKEDAKRFNTFA